MGHPAQTPSVDLRIIIVPQRAYTNRGPLQLNLTVSGKCDSTWLHSSLQPATGGDTVIDLTDMTFVTPMGLIAIMITAENAAAAGNRVVLKRPAQHDPAIYTSRIYEASVLDAYDVTHDLPPVHRTPRDTLLELTRFDSQQTAQDFAKKVATTVIERDRSRGEALHDALSEWGDNVTRHSKASGGFAMAQEYGYPTRRLHFAVGDAGIGFRSALGAERTSDDLDAIKKALAGMSSSPDTNAGRGSGLRSISKQVIALGGSLTISSGHGHHRVGMRSLSRLRPLGFPGSILEGVVQL